MYSRHLHAAVMRHNYALFRCFERPREFLSVRRRMETGSLDSKVANTSPTAFTIHVSTDGSVKYVDTHPKAGNNSSLS